MYFSTRASICFSLLLEPVVFEVEVVGFAEDEVDGVEVEGVDAESEFEAASGTSEVAEVRMVELFGVIA